MNNTWGTLEGTKKSTTPFDLDMINRALELKGKDLHNCQVFDYGSGEGRIISALIANGFAKSEKIKGADISTEIVARSIREHPELNSIVSVMEPGKTGMESNSVDFSMLMGVGVCNPSYVDFASVLMELYRIMKPGAVLYITDFLYTSFMFDTYAQYHIEHSDTEMGVYENKDGMKFIHRDMTDLMRMYLQVGFVPIESNLITITSINGHKYNGIKATFTK